MLYICYTASLPRKSPNILRKIYI